MYFKLIQVKKFLTSRPQLRSFLFKIGINISKKKNENDRGGKIFLTLLYMSMFHKARSWLSWIIWFNKEWSKRNIWKNEQNLFKKNDLYLSNTFQNARENKFYCPSKDLTVKKKDRQHWMFCFHVWCLYVVCKQLTLLKTSIFWQPVIFSNRFNI